MTDNKILIIEDNLLNLELTTDLLEANGFIVSSAQAAEEGLRIAEETLPDLVLMDFGLPGMDGLCATKNLKANPATRQLKVVGLTAHAMKGDEEIAMKAGCDGYLTKPIDTKTFAETIMRFIASGNSRHKPNTPAERKIVQSEIGNIRSISIGTTHSPGLAPVGNGERQPHAFLPHKRTEPGGDGIPMSILIVDDVATNRELLRATLEAQGMTVVEAMDGVDALAILEVEKIDAIISDILMPRMDGYRFCHQVRASSRFFAIPFIFYTATYTSPDDEKFSIELGGDIFLRKPVPATVIMEALSRKKRAFHPQPLSTAQLEDLTLTKEYNKRLVERLEQKNIELLVQTTALETAANAVTITDWKGTILWVNKAFSALNGYAPEEIIGKTSNMLKSGVHNRAFYQELWETVLAGRTWQGEFTNRRKDGSLYDGEQTITPVCSEGGTVTHFIGIMTDLTRVKKLEGQFIQAQKMEVIGHLAGGVAHDFNNILAVIIGYGELLTSELGEESPQQKYIKEVLNACERAVGLTQQLLVFSRKQTVQPVVLDLNEVMKGLEEMLRRLIGENIEMTIIPEEQAGRVKADSGYIGQVLMNLIVNARDAMPDGGKLTIVTGNATLDENSVDAPKSALPGEYVMLSVCDTGTGMTDEVKTHLFEALFTTKPQGKGTGLGLATCQTIVQQSGGYIDVCSEIGKGTTFKVYFPRVDLPLNVAPGPITGGSLPRGTETLLVVEDDPSVRHLAGSVLKAQGYEVLTAMNGKDGLSAAGEHQGAPISLVITDVIMPQMGGKAMAEWLKATYPDLKILFTSGYTDDTIAQHGVLEPGVAFLPKPYSPAVLARKVREMLDAPKA